MSSGRSEFLAAFTGGDREKETLIGLMNGGRFCHALLLTGLPGSGRRTFAWLAAAALLCEGEEKPCGECPHCRKIRNSLQAWLSMLSAAPAVSAEPEKKSKRSQKAVPTAPAANGHPDVIYYDCGDKAHDQHKIEPFRRAVMDTIPVAPNEAGRKVYILANLDKLAVNMSDVLLKSLEDPPEHVAFVLTAESPDSLPETILSRVVSLPIQPLADELLVPALQNAFPDAEPAALSKAAEMSFGSLGTAGSILTTPSLMSLANRAVNAAEALTSGNEYALMAALHLPEKEKDGLRELFRLLLLTCREGMSSAVLKRGSGLGFRLSGRMPPARWAAATALCEEALDMISHNVSRKQLPAWFAARFFQ